LRRGLFEEGAEAVGLGGGNVDEIERRRLLRQRRQELPRRLPSIWVMVTSSASPRPSDITTDGVSAPGR
jgi:hypothetical protein